MKHQIIIMRTAIFRCFIAWKVQRAITILARNVTSSFLGGS